MEAAIMQRSFASRRSIASALGRACCALATVALLLSGGCAVGRVTADPVYFPPSPATAHVVHLKSFNRLSDLVPRRPTFIELIRGEGISAHVSIPAGVAVRGSKLYLCDTEQSVVHVWNLETGAPERLGARGDAILQTPVAVCVDDRGVAYVADTGRGEVLAFEPGGALSRVYRPEGKRTLRPVAVAVREGTLFVADLENASVRVFDAASGEATSTITLSAKAGAAVMPLGLAVDSDGRLFVTDAMGGRVLILDADGALQGTISQRGDRVGDLGQPKHLALGPGGVLFVADAEFAHVHLFNDAGQLLMLLGGPQDRAGGTPMPLGVAVAPSLPESIRALVPDGFDAAYFLFVTDTLGSTRVSLFAVAAER